MSEDQRIPGHPADKYPTRPTSTGYSSPVQGPSNTQYPPTPSPGQVSYNTQTRNIIIGAIATIIASTSVYYLTQYVNTHKAQQSVSPSEIKLNTIDAWRRYVVIDNIYYKNITLLAADKNLSSDLDKYKAETFKLGEEFIKDAEALSKEKNIDKILISMVGRRVKKEQESQEKVSAFYNNLKSIATSTLDDKNKYDKMVAEINNFKQYSHLVLEMTATEVEDLSKALVNNYGNFFDPNEFLIYADYKKGKFNLDPIPEAETGDTTIAVRNIDPKKLMGKWKDEKNLVSLNKDGSMDYALNTGEKATGTWKIENDKLRIDAINTTTKIKTVKFFRLYDFTPDSFTMVNTVPPYDRYIAVRVKEK